MKAPGLIDHALLVRIGVPDCVQVDPKRDQRLRLNRRALRAEGQLTRSRFGSLQIKSPVPDLIEFGPLLCAGSGVPVIRVTILEVLASVALRAGDRHLLILRRAPGEMVEQPVWAEAVRVSNRHGYRMVCKLVAREGSQVDRLAGHRYLLGLVLIEPRL